jgi:Bacterial archaeo-eukaryotic release factor family 3
MLSQVDKLINHKGKPCLSIIIPTNSYAASWLFSWGTIKKNLKNAHDLISNNGELNSESALLFGTKLNDLSKQIDSKKFKRGIGIYISPTMAELIYFPFEVQERVSMDESFETRDLLYYREYASTYYVLMLNKDRVNLFKSEGDGVKELVDRNFPMLYTDDYEYSKPSRGTSYGESLKSFERDKASQIKQRMSTFFKEADRAVHTYLKNLDCLIVCGTDQETASFVKITNHRDLIAGALNIPSNRLITSDTISKFHDVIFRFKHTKQQKIVERLEEDYGNHQVAEGIENVWKAAHEGKGWLLAVEKNFKRKAFLKKGDEYNLHPSPPVGEYRIVADAVDDVIETVLEKNGKILFVENEELKKFNHIAMLLRYKNTQPVG